MFSVSAPGKIILSGEHSVVYGQPAILTTVDFENRVSIKAHHSGSAYAVNDGVVYFYSSEIRAKFKESEELLAKFRDTQRIDYLRQIVSSIHDFILITIGEFLDYFNKSFDEDFLLTIEVQTPVGRGFGSSASLAAVVVGALSRFYLYETNLEEVFEVVQRVETKIHGNPSGGDASAVVFGNTLLFQKDVKPHFFESKLDLNELGLILVDSSEPEETTGEMVSLVRKFVEQNSDSVIQKMGKITQGVYEAMIRGDSSNFLKLMQENELLLEEIGVVSNTTRGFCRKIEEVGGIAKIAGAGGLSQGSGVVLIFGMGVAELEEIVQSFKFSTYPKLKTDVPGLKSLD